LAAIIPRGDGRHIVNIHAIALHAPAPLFLEVLCDLTKQRGMPVRASLLVIDSFFDRAYVHRYISTYCRGVIRQFAVHIATKFHDRFS